MSSCLDDRGRTYAPVSKTKFVRDVVVAKDYLPSAAKKPRAENYYEERKQPLKHVNNVAEHRPAKPVHSPKFIQKKPVLPPKQNDEWVDFLPPKPKRVRIRRRPDRQQESSTNITATEPVETPEKQESVKIASAAKATDTGSKKADNKSNAEPNEEGVCELNNTMASILQDELRQIMVKVRQELPDDPQTEVEELVANKFRHEAGDDLQNAMGLNVTARLLNVHNPLYAKLHFSGKPEAGCLQAFIKKHKITAFKRIADSNRDIFAARFDRLADFDRLCVRTEVKCGSATVTIIPCYKYFSNPPTLKSIYADNIAKSKKQTSTDGEQKRDVDKTAQNVVNTEVKSDNAKAVVHIKSQKESVGKQPNTTPTKTSTTPNSKMPEKAVAVKAVAQEKPKQTVQEKLKPVVKETPKDVPVVTNKVTPKVEYKDKKKDIGDVMNDKQVKLDGIDAMMVVDEEGGEEDDEEMTDQDILALMSGGIVLDECSGSDDEK